MVGVEVFANIDGERFAMESFGGFWHIDGTGVILVRVVGGDLSCIEV